MGAEEKNLEEMTPQERYHKKNTKLFTIRLVETTEQDIIEKLDTVPNKSGYIKGLIREDIARENQEDHS